ncbi:hypothetical protein DM02DRAFT_620506, partial [Periconia macrospinosa]
MEQTSTLKRKRSPSVEVLGDKSVLVLPKDGPESHTKEKVKRTANQDVDPGDPNNTTTFVELHLHETELSQYRSLGRVGNAMDARKVAVRIPTTKDTRRTTNPHFITISSGLTYPPNTAVSLQLTTITTFLSLPDIKMKPTPSMHWKTLTLSTSHIQLSHLLFPSCVPNEADFFQIPAAPIRSVNISTHPSMFRNRRTSLYM